LPEFNAEAHATQSLEFCTGIVIGRHPINFSRGAGVVDVSGTKPIASTGPGFG
jgi:hypothetical protein